MSGAKLGHAGGGRWRWRLSLGGLLRELLARRNAVEAPLYGASAEDLELIRATRRLVPLLQSDMGALQIILCARAALGRPGAWAEAGVLAGGSARLLCALKGERPLHLFDIFDGPALAKDVGAHFGAIKGRRAEVDQLLSPFPAVHIHQGMFPESATGIAATNFAFAHLDLDLAEGTRKALDYFYPRLVPGGILLGDDYHLPAVRDSFEHWLVGRPDSVFRLPWGQIFVIKAG